MATIDTYDKLAQKIIKYSHRDDLDLEIPTFIELTETAMLANPQEILKVRGQEVTLATVTDGRTLPIPDDYQSMRSVRLITADEDKPELLFKVPSRIKYRSGTGMPTMFTVSDTIEFNVTPDTDYDIELKYYADPDPLTPDNQTNAVLTKFPTVYLYGGLWQAFEFAMDTENSAKYFQLFIGAVKGANKKDKQGRYGPAPAMIPAGTVV